MAPYHITRAPYVGSRRKLVLAFDVGTTFSGVSYSILDPGQPPEIKGVTKFPAHEQISGASKIPTIIYYDKAGNVCAVGAEALTEGIFETAEEEGWIKAEWFKMHIRPKNEASSHITARIPALPPNKTVVQVLADFLVYLYKKDIDFVISHPNGWEGYQQTQMREAVVKAGFVPDTREGHARVSFVTEGEASLHFSIRNGLPTGAMEKGDGVVIVDAGGGTIDISTYSRQVQPGYVPKDNVFEEIAAPQCHFYGSVFVSIHARLALQELLEESDYLDDLDHIVRCFDRTTKIRFSDDSQAQYIKFGSTRDNDANCGIRFGQLKVAGEQVASFFEPSIKCIVDAIKDQIKTAHKRISHVVLVGGFASSDWLFTQVQSRLSGDGLNTIRPEIYVNKAVSDGAISFYLDHLVKTRVSKMAYGTFRHIEYDASDAEHRVRLASTQIMPSGRKVVPDSFAVILPRNMQVQEEKEFQKKFWKEGVSKEELNLDKVTSEVWAYTGNSANPKWKNVEEDCYKKLCTIEMDLSHLPLRPSDKVEGTGDFFYLEYGYILQFSAVELKAQISWVENGAEKRSPAKIVYDPDD
ncbi:hypothetical protein FA13DRAFT_1888794 [Coprinellus micaceus]|uniref:Actin-like ATPase domain-containing protein n=1 Tax=Coprinellus micaceus TaxID=71717 RepID=A0A4Y7SXE3_COPMI|nr:hypothetical protein FA13DRAFT_1888794 [Coprinellus micaceus]